MLASLLHPPDTHEGDVMITLSFLIGKLKHIGLAMCRWSYHMWQS